MVLFVLWFRRKAKPRDHERVERTRMANREPHQPLPQKADEQPAPAQVEGELDDQKPE
ncbi:hypothetical protein D3C87_2118040 [compost metagenome]